jgi:hypothetical protein
VISAGYYYIFACRATDFKKNSSMTNGNGSLQGEMTRHIAFNSRKLSVHRKKERKKKIMIPYTNQLEMFEG